MIAAPDGKPTIGYLVDRLFTVREERREIAKQDKELKDEYDRLEALLLEAMDEQQTLKSGGLTASAVISTDIHPNVTDWDRVYEYLLGTESFHLLQRRINAAPWRELYESGELIPGTEPFTKRTISLRKV